MQDDEAVDRKPKGTANPDADAEVIGALRELAKRPGHAAERLRRSLTFIESNSRMATPRRDLKLMDTSPLRFQVGLESPDGSAILGRGGQLFLYRGNNDLIGIYDPARSAGQVEKARLWIDLVRRRKAACDALGVSFLQIVLPETPSVIPTQFPKKILTPSVLLRALEQEFKKESYYLSGLALLKSKHNLPSPLRKMDTHLSPPGAWLIIREVLARCFGVKADDPEFVDGEMLIGDLSLRFLGVPCYELLLYPSSSSVAALERGLEQIELHKPATGHNGSTVRYRNSTARVKKKVLVFGNSFFELGRRPTALSWWACRYIEDFRFVWSPVFDLKVAEAEKPDLVICQTIERFLGIVPAM